MQPSMSANDESIDYTTWTDEALNARLRWHEDAGLVSAYSRSLPSDTDDYDAVYAESLRRAGGEAAVNESTSTVSRGAAVTTANVWFPPVPAPRSTWVRLPSGQYLNLATVYEVSALQRGDDQAAPDMLTTYSADGGSNFSGDDALALDAHLRAIATPLSVPEVER